MARRRSVTGSLRRSSKAIARRRAIVSASVCIVVVDHLAQHGSGPEDDCPFSVAAGVSSAAGAVSDVGIPYAGVGSGSVSAAAGAGISEILEFGASGIEGSKGAEAAGSPPRKSAVPGSVRPPSGRGVGETTGEGTTRGCWSSDGIRGVSSRRVAVRASASARDVGSEPESGSTPRPIPIVERHDHRCLWRWRTAASSSGPNSVGAPWCEAPVSGIIVGAGSAGADTGAASGRVPSESSSEPVRESVPSVPVQRSGPLRASGAGSGSRVGSEIGSGSSPGIFESSPAGISGRLLRLFFLPSSSTRSSLPFFRRGGYRLRSRIRNRASSDPPKSGKPSSEAPPQIDRFEGIPSRGIGMTPRLRRRRSRVGKAYRLIKPPQFLQRQVALNGRESPPCHHSRRPAPRVSTSSRIVFKSIVRAILDLQRYA